MDKGTTKDKGIKMTVDHPKSSCEFSSHLESPKHTPALALTLGGIRKRASMQKCHLHVSKGAGPSDMGFRRWSLRRAQQ